MGTGKVVLGLLAGIAAGAVLGVLFAPDKGSVTRRKISKKSGEYVDELGEKYDEFVDSITRKFEKMKEETFHTAEKGKHKMDGVATEGTEKMK